MAAGEGEDRLGDAAAVLAEAAHNLAAALEVHPADARDEEGFPDPLGKARAAVPGRPAIWLEAGDEKFTARVV